MTADAGTAEIAGRFAAGFGVGATLGPRGSSDDVMAQVLPGLMSRRRLLDQMRYVPMPAVGAAPAAGALLLTGQQCGPADGLCWAAQRLTVAGLTTSGGIATSAQAATTTGAGGTATLPVGASISGFHFTALQAAVASGYTITVTGAQGGTQTYNVNAVTTQFTDFPSLFPAPIPPANPAVAIAVTVAANANGNSGNITAFGVTAAGTDQVILYKGSLHNLANPPQLMEQISPPITAASPTYHAGGKGIILNDSEVLAAYGTGLVTAGAVFSADLIEFESQYLADYLI